jgi:hypothetical protein
MFQIVNSSLHDIHIIQKFLCCTDYIAILLLFLLCDCGPHKFWCWIILVYKWRSNQPGTLTLYYSLRWLIHIVSSISKIDCTLSVGVLSCIFVVLSILSSIQRNFYYLTNEMCRHTVCTEIRHKIRSCSRFIPDLTEPEIPV